MIDAVIAGVYLAFGQERVGCPRQYGPSVTDAAYCVLSDYAPHAGTPHLWKRVLDGMAESVQRDLDSITTTP